MVDRFIEKFVLWGIILSSPILFIIHSIGFYICPSDNHGCVVDAMRFIGFIEPKSGDGFPTMGIWILLAAFYGALLGAMIGFILRKYRRVRA